MVYHVRALQYNREQLGPCFSLSIAWEGSGAWPVSSYQLIFAVVSKHLGYSEVISLVNHGMLLRLMTWKVLISKNLVVVGNWRVPSNMATTALL